jgi:prepilin-type N-terminal cleavage/methylation domain-containing protein
MRHLATARGHRGGHGFTLFEVAVSLLIVAVLAGVLLQRLHFVQQRAERAAVAQTVAILRVALTVKTAHLLATHRDQEIATLALENPFDWLAEKPQNYLGEYFAPDPRDLHRGNWYFDRKEKTLVYLLNSEKTFPTGISNALKFKIKLDHSPQSAAELPQGQDVTSVSIAQVDR